MIGLIINGLYFHDQNGQWEKMTYFKCIFLNSQFNLITYEDKEKQKVFERLIFLHENVFFSYQVTYAILCTLLLSNISCFELLRWDTLLPCHFKNKTFELICVSARLIKKDNNQSLVAALIMSVGIGHFFKNNDKFIFKTHYSEILFHLLLFTVTQFTAY